MKILNKYVNQKTNQIIIIFFLILILLFVFLHLQNKKDIVSLDNKRNIQQMSQQAIRFYNNGDFLDAIEQYKQIINLEPQDYIAYINLGNSYLQLGNYSEALKIFENALNLNDNDFRGYHGLGQAYYLKEDYIEAYKNLNEAYDLNPKSSAVIYDLVNIYNALGLYDKAIEFAKNKLEKEPANNHYYRKIGIAYFLKYDSANALNNIRKAVELDESNSNNHFIMATIYLSLGHEEDALTQLKTAMALSPNNPVYEGLSITYQLLGDNEKYEKSSTFAVAYPKHSFSLSLLGFALLQNKKYEKAIEEFTNAINEKPEYYLPYKGLGKVYIELGQKDKAINNFEKAINLNDLDEESKKLLEKLKNKV